MERIIKPKAILVDVEGTTTSNKFYSNKIIPFIKTNTEPYLRQNWGQPLIMETIEKMRKRAEKDRIQNTSRKFYAIISL